MNLKTAIVIPYKNESWKRKINYIFINLFYYYSSDTMVSKRKSNTFVNTGFVKELKNYSMPKY